MSYDATTSFLRSHASTSLSQAVLSRESIVLARETPPTVDESTFDFDVVKPTREAPPQLSDLLNALESENNGSPIATPDPTWLNEQSDAWMAQYFPNATAEFKTIPEDWLIGVIGGSQPYGMADTVFEAVWHRARDRANKTRTTSLRQIEAGTSARGFTLPTGAMIDAVDQANQLVADAALEVNREEAIKDAEVKQELLKMAVQIASDYRLGIMRTLAEFHRAWVQLFDRDRDLDRMQARAQAIGALYNAVGSYYNVEVAFEQLRLRAEEVRAGLHLDVDKTKVALHGTRERSADALGQATRAFADISAAAANAASSLTAEIESL